MFGGKQYIQVNTQGGKICGRQTLTIATSVSGKWEGVQMCELLGASLQGVSYGSAFCESAS